MNLNWSTLDNYPPCNEQWNTMKYTPPNSNYCVYPLSGQATLSISISRPANSADHRLFTKNDTLVEKAVSKVILAENSCCRKVFHWFGQSWCFFLQLLWEFFSGEKKDKIQWQKRYCDFNAKKWDSFLKEPIGSPESHYESLLPYILCIVIYKGIQS